MKRKIQVRVRCRVYVRGELKGQSKWRNLILDNFGLLLAGLISHHDVTTTTHVGLVDDGGVSRDVAVATYRPETTDHYVFVHTSGSDIGGHMRIGSGTTAPARGDYGIETPFTVAPESDYFDAGTGVYSAGTITISGSITAGGSGTINEAGFFFKLRDAASLLRIIMLFHDAISPGVSFSAGDPITVEYSISL